MFLIFDPRCNIVDTYLADEFPTGFKTGLAIEMGPKVMRTMHVPDTASGVDDRGLERPGAGRPFGVVAWIPGRDIDQNEWVAVGRRLGGIVRCSQWWIGDWVSYGSTKWGQKYVVAARITGYDVHSLRNMVWVASRFEPSRRRDDLTWSHHASVATLEANEQDHWLDRASSQKLSVLDLRIEIRAARQGRGGASGIVSRTHSSGWANIIRCPQCGLEINTQTGST
jgi:hypothetical protein